MHKRTNPWPAFADLFSALLIATFAGFIMMSGAYQSSLAPRVAREQALEKVRQEADAIMKQVQETLSQDSSLKAKTRPCGDGFCIDLDIHFRKDKDEINPEQTPALKEACQKIKQALDKFAPEQRRDIIITIEGHTDSQKLAQSYDERTEYLYNWNLSAQRAASVLYIFKQCDLKQPQYKILSIGSADTANDCNEDTPKCHEENRRTTLQLHADIQEIEARLKRLAQVQ
jgi:flagellar motor protein MotB